MDLGYDAEVNDASWALVRRGRGPRGKSELLLVLGLVGLFLTALLAPADTEVPVGFTLLAVSGVLLTVAAHGFGWQRARGSMLVSEPRRVEIEQAGLRIGARLFRPGEVVRIELHRLPSGDGSPSRYLVAIVSTTQVAELTFADLDAAQNIATELVTRLGVGELVVRERPVFRGYGALLALPIFLAVIVETGAAMLMLAFALSYLQMLLPISLVLGASLGVFLLTWWWGRSAARSLIESEYGNHS